jgi:hypothetical protein
MPFFRTALVSSRGAARSHGSDGEDIVHFNAIRFRVNGTGDLQLELFSLDDADSQQLNSIPMSLKPGRQPTVLANFVTQRMSLTATTRNINDYFRINRIIIFSKYYASSYPQ